MGTMCRRYRSKSIFPIDTTNCGVNSSNLIILIADVETNNRQYVSVLFKPSVFKIEILLLPFFFMSMNLVFPKTFLFIVLLLILFYCLTINTVSLCVRIVFPFRLSLSLSPPLSFFLSLDCLIFSHFLVRN